MVTALYRRYRPENFGELIGQNQVTDPLVTALSTNRINHAYLFSGPRGCGKTTSARILARCLNCAEGPTPNPCGKCASCVELSRDGSGSLDVVEIDAASHNGVEDARELRERAGFAPARDRFKIFILDEAHMVTPQGFNALLKIVEEPPEHVKFVFATTEPEKVISTIRSRTHHYPFRLVPPSTMLDYLGEILGKEGITAQPGVLPLVVRAGGGSVRDTLSILDQLIAGSEGTEISYDRTVALLGYTHSALLDEVIDALTTKNGEIAFAAVDRVIQTGQDPRRFVEDLLERLRDLILVSAAGNNAASVLRGVEPDELAALAETARRFGAAALSKAADTVAAALPALAGATSPRLQLEILIARLLVAGQAAHASTEATAPDRKEAPRPVASKDAAPIPNATQRPAVAAPVSPRPATAAPAVSQEPPAAASPTMTPSPEPEAKVEPESLSIEQIRAAWPEVIAGVEKIKRSSWAILINSIPADWQAGVLTIAFKNPSEAVAFKPGPDSVVEHLRVSISKSLGVAVQFKVQRPEEFGVPTSEPAPTTEEIRRFGESVLREVLNAKPVDGQ